jgi:galactokinase
LYEVTGYELDAMFEAMRKHSGFIGGRMTGAGFGGCAIAVVRKDVFEDFCNDVRMDYWKATGYSPQFYIAKASEGVREEL